MLVENYSSSREVAPVVLLPIFAGSGLNSPSHVRVLRVLRPGVLRPGNDIRADEASDIDASRPILRVDCTRTGSLL